MEDLDQMALETAWCVEGVYRQKGHGQNQRVAKVQVLVREAIQKALEQDRVRRFEGG